jgi:hypothetical protein
MVAAYRKLGPLLEKALTKLVCKIKKFDCTSYRGRTSLLIQRGFAVFLEVLLLLTPAIAPKNVTAPQAPGHVFQPVPIFVIWAFYEQTNFENGKTIPELATLLYPCLFHRFPQ